MSAFLAANVGLFVFPYSCLIDSVYCYRSQRVLIVFEIIRCQFGWRDVVGTRTDYADRSCPAPDVCADSSARWDCSNRGPGYLTHCHCGIPCVVASYHVTLEPIIMLPNIVHCRCSLACRRIRYHRTAASSKLPRHSATVIHKQNARYERKQLFLRPEFRRQ